MELDLDSSWDGQVAECPNCKREFTIEVPDQTIQQPRPQIVQPQYSQLQQPYAQPQYGQPQQPYAQPQQPYAQPQYGQPQQPYAQPQQPYAQPQYGQPQQPYAQPQQPYAQPQYGQPPVPPKKSSPVVWIILGCVAGVLLIVGILISLLLVPALGSAREKARRIACTSNMKQIMTACKMYSQEFSEKFPSGCSYDNSYLREILDKQYPWAKALPAPLDLLVSNGHIIDQKVFECPSNPGKCSYLMVGSGFSEDDDPDLPILFELPSNHGGGYINVGYAGGWVFSVNVPKDCKTAEQVAEFLLKKVDISSAKREQFMRNVREAERQLNR